MADNERIICESSVLLEREHGLRFDLPELGRYVTGFAVRYNGVVYAYVNRCAHVSVELDWNEGDFFDFSKNYLLCATHGAHYEPQSGYCVMGPCKGRSLQPIMVIERDSKIFINLDSIKEESLKYV
ncbi:MAG TPA: Rieske 2Fe-2S domain-containing protein [Methylophilaceae bacterium]|nr:Rieske 2Fe-2S domain-containing protein [Methylophilaceae bacterium]